MGKNVIFAPIRRNDLIRSQYTDFPHALLLYHWKFLVGYWIFSGKEPQKTWKGISNIQQGISNDEIIRFEAGDMALAMNASYCFH